MTENRTPDANPDPDAVLDRHIEKLKATVVPAGPSPAAFAATLALFDRPAAPRRHPFLETLIMLSRQPMVRTAFVAVLCTGVYLLLFSSLGTSAAFADVAERLKDAKTMTYTTTIALPNRPAMSTKTFARADGAYRVESPGDLVTILRGHQTLTLMAASHTAMVTEMVGLPTTRPTAALGDPGEWLRHLGDAEAHPIGKKTIDGVEAAGFTTTLNGNATTVWADPKTSVPLRIEMSMPVANSTAAIVLSEFKFDVPMDDALFSLDVPAGYTLKTQTLRMPVLGETAAEVAKLLGDYAKLSDGAFPDNLTDWAAFFRLDDKAGEAKRTETIGRVGAISGMLFSLPHGYGYAGSHVHLGDKDSIVFWIKPAPGVPTARAVYGDLRVADVAVAALPATQPMQ